MKVGILVIKFPNLVQTYILSQLYELQNQGVDLHIIAREKLHYTELPPRLEKFLASHRPSYIDSEADKIWQQLPRLPVFKGWYLKNLGELLQRDFIQEFGFKYLIKAMVHSQILRGKPYDVLHSHSLFSTYDYLFARQQFGIPLITTFHGLVPQGVKKLPESKLEKVFATGDCFLVNTRFSRALLTDMGCPAEKIKIIPQGTDLSDYPFTPRQAKDNDLFHILTVGRLTREKGQHIALAAVARLASQYPSLRYHIVGSGPEQEKLKTQAKTLGCEDRIIFHGFLSDAEVKALYARAHLFILPSVDLNDGYHVETQGVVIQEAQASGLPVIASATGGIPEVIKAGETGLLFESENIADLAGQIEKVYCSDELYRSLVKNGWEDVKQRFDIQVITRQIMDVYRSFNQDKYINTVHKRWE